LPKSFAIPSLKLVGDNINGLFSSFFYGSSSLKTLPATFNIKLDNSSTHAPGTYYASSFFGSCESLKAIPPLFLDINVLVTKGLRPGDYFITTMFANCSALRPETNPQDFLIPNFGSPPIPHYCESIFAGTVYSGTFGQTPQPGTIVQINRSV
jgi:hypothetical protein